MIICDKCKKPFKTKIVRFKNEKGNKGKKI